MSELDKWERSQGGYAFQGGAGVWGTSAPGRSGTGFTAASGMQKGFDGSEWAQSHQDEFRSLIAKAREKRNAAASNKTTDKLPNEEKEPILGEAIDEVETPQTGTTPVSDMKNTEAQLEPSKTPEAPIEAGRNIQSPDEDQAMTDVAQPGYSPALDEVPEAHALGPNEAENRERWNGSNEVVTESMPEQKPSLSGGARSPEAMREDGCVDEGGRLKQPMFAAPS